MSNSCKDLSNINDVILHSKGVSQAEVVRQAHNDEQVVGLWLHGRSPHTQKAYAGDIVRFFKHVDKQLRYITLGNLQGFADSLIDEELKPASQHRILAAVKSLITFAHKIGYLQYDVSKPLRVPKFKDELSERIMSEAEVQRIIGMENNPRNKLLLRILYAGGIRVSELCRLKWRDVQERDDGGQMTVFGKGSKTNTIIIPEPLWGDLISFRKNSIDDAPVFRSRKGGHLHPSQVWRIVKKSAKRAGIKKAVSPHWFRHAHASHALDRGAKISLVKETLSHSSISTTGRYLHAKPNECSSTYLQV
ncbi:MAG: tyrosine-type recombinase/integrase [Planctomycetes bacterium]|nr:tyrosine-type recombinase/integrase [Planctomycetota bacterium]